MSIPAIITLVITIIATALLVGNWMRPDLVALLVLVTLGVTGLVSPNDALAGFSGSAVITILAISIIAEGLQQAGIASWLGQRMKHLSGQGGTRLLVVVMVSGAVLSMFMNNIAAMAVLLPATMGLARQSRIPPSRLLMPLAYGVIAGGMATLFTTSNIIASGALQEAGLKPFGVLDFLPIGLPLVIIAVLYVVIIGQRLLPDRDPAMRATNFHRLRDELLQTYSMEKSLWEVKVLPGSSMAGQTIRQGNWRTKVRLNVLGITRNGNFLYAPNSDTVIREKDVVIAQGEPPREALESCGLSLFDKPVSVGQTSGRDVVLAELVLAPHSNLAGKTLREIHFREKFNLTVLALWRSGKSVHIGFANMPLEAGDGLLVQGSIADLHMLYQERDFIVLEEDPEAILRPEKSRMATIISLATLIIAISGWLPIALISLAGAVAMILTGCINMDEAYKSIDWKAIFLIAGMWPLSTAIQSSGLSNEIVQGLLDLAGRVSPVLLVALLLFVTLIFTNIMAGQAAAPIVLAPIGLSIAKATNTDPRMILMAIALGCSLAFSTPIGHPVNVIVMGSGGYTFKDFFRVGWLLTILLFLAILLGLHFFWGL